MLSSAVHIQSRSIIFLISVKLHLSQCGEFLFPFQGNSVSTTKYDVVTFLPKGLFEQVNYFISHTVYCFFFQPFNFSLSLPSLNCKF